MLGLRMVLRDNAMNDASQLATAMVAITFTAMLLITGQWFVDYQLEHEARASIVRMGALPP
jgi:hypothetical protein